VSVLRINVFDAESRLAVDLRHLLDALGERAIHSLWEISEVSRFGEPLMVTGEGRANVLDELARSKKRISGTLLHELAHSVDQVIWGEFRAFEDGGSAPWVIIRAIDSTWYEVETQDDAALAQIRKAFEEAQTVG
jgi:hypothetical protein